MSRFGLRYPSVIRPVSWMKQAAIASIVTCATSSALANEPATWTGTWYFENDLFTDTDQDYTNGVRFSAMSPDISSFEDDESLPQWTKSLYKLADRFNPEVSRREHLQRNLVATIGQKMYTPGDIYRTTVDPNDRPYAGWLYLGAAYQGRHENQLNALAINIGIVGPASLAHETQDFIHKLRGLYTFKGWDNQLNNELGIQVISETKNRRLTGVSDLQLPVLGNLEYDLITHKGFSLGNIETSLNAGAEARLGFQLPHDFGTSSLRTAGDNSSPGRFDNRSYSSSQASNIGAHAFVATDARWVLHNIFLDGNTFSDSHSVDKEPLVADVAVGIAAVYKGFKLSVARVHRTREFKTQDGAHHFGSIALSYSCNGWNCFKFDQ